MLDTIFQNMSFSTFVPIITVVLTAWYNAIWIRDRQRIAALGGRAPQVAIYLPFGLDLTYRGVRAAIRHRNLEFWEWLFSSFGTAGSPYTVEAQVGPQRFIFTAEPENIKAILATQFEDYGKGRPFHEDWKDFLGDSIFTTDGEQWHASRSLIRPQFIRDRVSDLAIFEKHVNVLLGLMGGRGQEVDVSALFFRYTLDAATDFLLGTSVDSLRNSQAEFAEAFAEVQRVQNIIARAGPMNRLVPCRSFHAALKTINAFVNPYIDRALHLSPTELDQKTGSDTSYTFLHALARFTRDRTVIRDQLVAILLAGRDSTAATLSWLFYELSRHPSIVARLRAEITAHLGPDRRAPTYADLKAMRYLQNCLAETLRLYPAVPFNVRMSLRDTTLPRGGGPDGRDPVGVLADTAIGYSTLVMHRRPDLYPPPSAGFPDVGCFAPQRWEGGWAPRSWQYIPFNGGPRICVGQGFALAEMGYTVVRILQRFEGVQRYWGEGEQFLKAEIVLQPGAGVRVGFWEAAEAGEAGEAGREES